MVRDFACPPIRSLLLLPLILGLFSFAIRADAAEPPLAPNDPAVFSERLQLPYGAPVSTGAAKRLSAAAIAEAEKHGWTIAVAVVDPGGVLVYFERMDGTQNASPHIAIEKARTAAAFRRSTKLIEDRVVAGRLQYLQLPGAMPIEGGLPIVQDGLVVGAVAVSGARSEEDGVCVKAAVDALAAESALATPQPRKD